MEPCEGATRGCCLCNAAGFITPAFTVPSLSSKSGSNKGSSWVFHSSDLVNPPPTHFKARGDESYCARCPILGPSWTALLGLEISKMPFIALPLVASPPAAAHLSVTHVHATARHGGGSLC